MLGTKRSNKLFFNIVDENFPEENSLEDNTWTVMENNLQYTLERSTFLLHSSIFMIFTCDNKMLESNWLKLVSQSHPVID